MNSFKRKAGLCYLSAKCKIEDFVEEKVKSFFQNEDGDTNFISILIVLGIVILLLVVFQGYIKTILGKVGESMSKFKMEV